jgi:ArsR family transcriptional regulator
LYVDEARVRAVAGRMPPDAAITRVTETFKVLADPTRARLVFALSQAELCVCDLASLVGISVSAVSHQLRLLRSLGLVKFRKEGRLAYYTLSDSHVEQLLGDALAHIEHLHAEA